MCIQFANFPNHSVLSQPMEKYLTTREAAEFWGVTPSRIRQLIHQGRLKSHKQGRDHLLLKADIKKFVEHGGKKRGRPKKGK